MVKTKMATPTPNKKKEKKVPLGKPLNLSDKQLDQLSKVTQVDIEKAKALWRNTVPAEFESLLDAQTVEEDEEL
jgi:hypothetical protein